MCNSNNNVDLYSAVRSEDTADGAGDSIIVVKNVVVSGMQL